MKFMKFLKDVKKIEIFSFKNIFQKDLFFIHLFSFLYFSGWDGQSSGAGQAGGVSRAGGPVRWAGGRYGSEG